MSNKTKPTIKIISLLLTVLLLFSFNISNVFSASPLAPKPTKTPTKTPTRTPTRTPSPTITNTIAPTGTPFTCTSWNITNDFRISPNQENPNRDLCNNVGVWEYMGSGSLPRNPANYYRLPIFAANFGGYTNLNTYYTGSSFPHIGYNAGPTVVEGAITIPANTFDVHPSPYEMAIMAWHSAVSGYINISGGVSDNSPGCGDGILWYIDKNATNLASGGFVNGGSQLFSAGTDGAALNTVAVSVGDVIYLAIDPNGGYGCDDTLVDLTISVTSPPTPTLTPTVTLTSTSTVTPMPSDLVNVYRYQVGSNSGAYSAIVTGDPTLRSDPTGQWSYMRVAAQRIINGNVYYVEIGWLKGAQAESNFVPRSYWAYRDINGTKDQGFDGYPGIGLSYNYMVKQTSSNTWSFYFNDLNVPIETWWVGWDSADRIFSGAEVPNNSQGIGDSYNNNVQYLDSTGTTWFGACNTTLFNEDPIKYFVDAGSNCSSWRIYGNN